jgi:branched-chain amino acid transport system ATP-binding protein
MLRIEKVTAGYRKITILKSVSAELQDQEIVAIVGSNGAGKSTLLRSISGFIRPFSGQIYFQEEDISQLPSHAIVEKGIVQVPEARQLFSQLTVLGNLELGSFPRKARGKKKDTLNQVYQIFPRLSERKDQPAGSLSGGEQQMLAIARALMSNPRLLMLDEPSLGLAPLLVEHIFDTVREIRRTGVSILIVEQNIFESLQLSDRAYVLENGEIVLQGTGEELLKNESVKSAYLGI